MLALGGRSAGDHEAALPALEEQALLICRWTNVHEVNAVITAFLSGKIVRNGSTSAPQPQQLEPAGMASLLRSAALVLRLEWHHCSRL